MKIYLSLFGGFLAYAPEAILTIEIIDGARVADLRTAVQAYALAHWPGFPLELLARSVFASEILVLRDGEAVPEDGRMAVLPPANHSSV